MQVLEKTGSAISIDDWKRLRADAIDSGLGSIIKTDHNEIPDVLLKYQSKLLQSTALYSVTVVEKSRRTGATWALGADAVLTAAAQKKAGGMDVLYLGYNLDMTREFIDVCAMWARSFERAAMEVDEFFWADTDKNGEPTTILAFRIRFASGFEIVALTSKPRSLRGRQGYVIIDEAAFHDDLDEVLKAAIALLIWGGKICVISTHDGEDNSFNQLINETRAGKNNYGLVRFDFDDALKDGLYKRVCLVTGKTWSLEAEAEWRNDIITAYGDGADEELFCIPSKGSGVFLPGALIRTAQRDDIPVFRWEVPDSFVHLSDSQRERDTLEWCEEHLKPELEKLTDHNRHAMGADFGRVHDLTVFWPLVIEHNLNKRTPFVVELRNMPFKQQEQIGKYIANRLPRLSGLAPDGTGLGAATSEAFLQAYGEAIVSVVMLSQKWYREQMPKVKSAFEDREFLIPKDDDIYNDFRLFRTVNGIAQIPSDKRTLEVAKKDRKRHGDGGVAAALALFAAELEGHEYGYTPISELHDIHDDDYSDHGHPNSFGFGKGGVW